MTPLQEKRNEFEKLLTKTVRDFQEQTGLTVDTLTLTQVWEPKSQLFVKADISLNYPEPDYHSSLRPRNNS